MNAFQILTVIILLVFYGCYYAKKTAQKKKGIGAVIKLLSVMITRIVALRIIFTICPTSNYKRFGLENR